MVSAGRSHAPGSNGAMLQALQLLVLAQRGGATLQVRWTDWGMSRVRVSERSAASEGWLDIFLRWLKVWQGSHIACADV
jgi:hypothetical protein